MIQTFRDMGLIVWMVGAFLCLISPAVVAAVGGLAVFGLAKWQGRARLAAVVPLASGVLAILMGVAAGNLGPPLFVGFWFVFLMLYSVVVLLIYGLRPTPNDVKQKDGA